MALLRPRPDRQRLRSLDRARQHADRGFRSLPLSAFGAALSLPLSLAAPLGARLRVAPFVSRGVGLGRISSEDDSESGQRLLLGGGVTLTNGSGRFRATAGLNRILIEEGETVFGVSLAYGR